MKETMSLTTLSLIIVSFYINKSKQIIVSVNIFNLVKITFLSP